MKKNYTFHFTVKTILKNSEITTLISTQTFIQSNSITT